jgi:hypothetical protein
LDPETPAGSEPTVLAAQIDHCHPPVPGCSPHRAGPAASDNSCVANVWHHALLCAPRVPLGVERVGRHLAGCGSSLQPHDAAACDSAPVGARGRRGRSGALMSLTPVTDPHERIPIASASFFVGALLVLVSYIGVELYWFTRLVTVSVPTTAVVENVFEEYGSTTTRTTPRLLRM